MRIRLSFLAAALTLAVACSDEPSSTAPTSRTAATSVSDVRTDRALSTSAIGTASAKPTDQVGFTKVTSVESPTAHNVNGSSFTATATAVCPAGSVAVGGGYSVYQNADGVRVLSVGPSVNNGWSVTMETISPFVASTFSATVMCIQ